MPIVSGSGSDVYGSFNLESLSDTEIDGTNAIAHFKINYSGWSVEINAQIPLEYTRNELNMKNFIYLVPNQIH